MGYPLLRARVILLYMDPLELIDQATENHGWTPTDLLTQNGLALIANWVAGGASMRDIAKKLGIPLGVLRQWRATYSELNRVLEEADDVAVAKVESALLRRALGYETTETVVEERETRDGVVETHRTTTKEVAPDVSAATFWLKNRAPHRWADSSRVDINVMATEAQQILAVMDTALSHIGLTTAQRAALPDALSAAIRAHGLASEEVKQIEN